MIAGIGSFLEEGISVVEAAVGRSGGDGTTKRLMSDQKLDPSYSKTLRRAPPLERPPGETAVELRTGVVPVGREGNCGRRRLSTRAGASLRTLAPLPVPLVEPDVRISGSSTRPQRHPGGIEHLIVNQKLGPRPTRESQRSPPPDRPPRDTA